MYALPPTVLAHQLNCVIWSTKVKLMQASQQPKIGTYFRLTSDWRAKYVWILHLTGGAALSEPRAAYAKSRILTTYGANERSTHP